MTDSPILDETRLGNAELRGGVRKFRQSALRGRRIAARTVLNSLSAKCHHLCTKIPLKTAGKRENFKGPPVQSNSILRDMVKRPGAQRREYFVILLSHRFATNDATSALRAERRSNHQHQ